MGCDVNTVESDEGQPAIEMTGADQVGLMQIAHPLDYRCRVGQPPQLRAPAASSRVDQPRSIEDPLDRPDRGRLDPELAQLPGDRIGPDLRPGVLGKTPSDLDHLGFELGGGAVGDSIALVCVSALLVSFVATMPRRVAQADQHLPPGKLSGETPM